MAFSPFVPPSGGGRSLNPNASEFVPSVFRPNHEASEASNRNPTKGTLDRMDSLNSSASDEESRRYWSAQLPDDITPDFGLMEDDPSLVEEASRQSSTVGELNMTRPQSGSYAGVNAWGHGEHQGNHNGLNEECSSYYSDEVADIDPVTILACEFPGFAPESLADVFHANGGDLYLTMEMLAQLELQEGAPQHHLQPQPVLNLDSMDFPALSQVEVNDGFSGEGEVQASSRAIDLRSLFVTKPSFYSNSLRADTDFATVARKNADQWSRARNGPRNNQYQTSAVASTKGSSIDDTEKRESRRAPPVWLETGDAVAKVYSELREEARDHARTRNAYFDQASQAYLVGNKALAKDLSIKGQLFNGLMKAAHTKASESIFQQRNVSARLQLLGQQHSQLLDLHGLHVNEAIQRLKQELASLRVVARSTHERQQVFVCVGTGHHTKGTARLPLAVERFLSQESNLSFSEPQPGMFRVVVS